MIKHYSYGVDHDTGFAPHVAGNLCTVCGCKRTTVEKGAKPGSWVIGVGGKGTGKPGRLIYAMKVWKTPPYRRFRKEHPGCASYLRNKDIPLDAPVLVSRHFFYFGDAAPTIPEELHRRIHRFRRTKCWPDSAVELLKRAVLSKYEPGIHGNPCNLLKKCGAKCRAKTPCK